MQLRGCSSQQHRHLGLNRCSRRNVACVSAERQQQHGTSSSSLEHAQPQQPPPPAITSQQPQPQAQLLCSPQVGVAAIRAQQQVQQQAEPLQDSVLQQIVGQSGKLPNQADQLWGDPSDRESRDVALVEPATRSYADLDYLSVSLVLLDCLRLHYGTMMGSAGQCCLLCPAVRVMASNTFGGLTTSPHQAFVAGTYADCWSQSWIQAVGTRQPVQEPASSVTP